MYCNGFIYKEFIFENMKSGGSRWFLFYPITLFLFNISVPSPEAWEEEDVTPFQERWRRAQHPAVGTLWVGTCLASMTSSQLRTLTVITDKVRAGTPGGAPGFHPALLHRGGQLASQKARPPPSSRWGRANSSHSHLGAARPSPGPIRHPLTYSSATPARPSESVAPQVAYALPLPRPPPDLPVPLPRPSQRLSSPVLTLWDGRCVQSPDLVASADYPCRFLFLSSLLTPQLEPLLTLSILRIPNPLFTPKHTAVATQTPQPSWPPRTQRGSSKSSALCTSGPPAFLVRPTTSSEKAAGRRTWANGCLKHRRQFQKNLWWRDKKPGWLLFHSKALKQRTNRLMAV